MTQSTPRGETIPRPGPLKRRGLVIGVGAVGAAAVAVKMVPGAATEAAAALAAAPKVTETDGGYRLSPHVLRYYETTRS